ncbi:hypothetical protein Aple_075290 [Acrocarpospora pleiomorpha]|uniref:Uncharacterized protein n=1 Tax=Acrocarpospora pleiomorpha TaxID=90975 RepID=A0A5M3XUQ8_9ACTN|nr:hypothetical protein [Acrocarpospora pleiomorpha]GES24630.1 hypothetical protein Aple_075290 [Acrocarpospora pleiomorpha]
MTQAPGPNPYVAIGRHRPNRPSVGGTYLGITETVAGHEREFNRWYEDDHFYSGAMAGPWILSGRRWVATHAMRKTWVPEDSPIISPHGQGCYFKTYWFATGHEDDAELWMNEAFKDLMEPDRFPTMRFGSDNEPKIRRNSSYSSFQRHLFTCALEPGPLQAVHALDYPFGGLALDVIQVDRSPAHYLVDIRPALQDTLAGAECKIAVAFERAPNQWLPSAREPEHEEFTVLWFFDAAPPPEGYAPRLTDFHRAIDEAGGRLALSACFVPTIPGTDTYVDELRAPRAPR